MTTTLTAAAGPINSSASVTPTPTNDRFNSIINVTDPLYGATGNGSTDDTAAKLINARLFNLRAEVSR